MIVGGAVLEVMMVVTSGDSFFFDVRDCEKG